MPSLTQALLHLGGSILTARAQRRLRTVGTEISAQQRTFKALCAQLALTAYGKAHGLEAGLDYPTFTQRLPITTYADYAPYVQRMLAGEAHVLWPGTCRYFAQTPATATGTAKVLPITPALLHHFRKASTESWLTYTSRVGHARIWQGRHLWVTGSSTLQRIDPTPTQPMELGEITTICAQQLPSWFARLTILPTHGTPAAADWRARLQAIAERVWQQDISLLAGLPTGLLQLLDAVMLEAGKNGEQPATLKDLWPNLECVVHTGMPITPLFTELHTLMGRGVNFHEVYAATEGLVAVQDVEAASGLRLLADTGMFYEFLPWEEKNRTTLAERTGQIVPLAGVTPGVDYAPLLTSPGGLTRYLLGDIVRFTSTDIPRLHYVGRIQNSLNLLGEVLTEKIITEALARVTQDKGWLIADFHVAPLHSRRGLPPRHEWWIELKPFSLSTPTGPVLASELDGRLSQIAPAYASARQLGTLASPLVRLVMPGVFEHWQRSKNQWGGHFRTAHCLNNRRLADELARLTRFHSEA